MPPKKKDGGGKKGGGGGGDDVSFKVKVFAFLAEEGGGDRGGALFSFFLRLFFFDE